MAHKPRAERPPPNRVNDQHLALAQMVSRYLLQKNPHIPKPWELMKIAVVGASTATAKAGTDANPTGQNFPWLLPYSATSPPVAGDQVAIANSPGGSYIIGKLSC